MRRIKIPLDPDSAKRFWPKVRVLDNGCWIWIGCKSKRGYGRFYSHMDNGKAKIVFAHVWAYEQTIGQVPDGSELDHLCRNHSCVNPLHCEPVAHSVNILRGSGIAATNARKTHCANGHPFTIRRNGKGRVCKICSAAHNLQKYHQRKAG